MATDRADEIAREIITAHREEHDDFDLGTSIHGEDALVEAIATALRSYGDSLLEDVADRLDEGEERAAQIVRAFKTSPTQDNAI